MTRIGLVKKDGGNAIYEFHRPKTNAGKRDIPMTVEVRDALTHTFAAKCIAKGMQPKMLQKILGHRSLQMTMDLYCHVEPNTLK